MAPPLLARPDASGKVRKITLGPWLAKLLPVLAKGKALRGTVLDIFGYTSERREERRWAREVKEAVLQVAQGVNDGNREEAIALLSLPLQVRGYGHVRAEKYAQVRDEWARLLAEFHEGGRTSEERTLAMDVS